MAIPDPAIFVIGLIEDMAAVKRVGAPLMGVFLPCGLAADRVALRSQGERPVARVADVGPAAG